METCKCVRIHWEFHSEDDLHNRLYTYRAFLDADTGGGGTDGPGQAYDDALSRRLEIDQCLAELRDRPHRLLLDAYFRQGRCDEATGWVTVAGQVGLEVKRKHMSGSKWKFDDEVGKAVGELWTVHEGRRERMLARCERT